MTRNRWLHSIRFLCLVLATGSLSPDAHAQIGEGGLPLSIQRILVSPANVAKELEKVQQGTLVPWSLPKFEERLEQARKVTQARTIKPRLMQAKYSAELIGSAFTQGTGQWLIQYPGAEPALLPIERLNMALAKLRWERGNEAQVGEFDGKTLSLLVAPAAAKGETQTCFFDWSARGQPGNDGLAFSLLVPSCPITTFDLKLPAENWLLSPKNAVLIQGPLDAGTPNHRHWKVHAAGQSQIDLIVRKISEPKGAGPTLFARVQSVQALERDRITLLHEYQLDILHGSISELYLESDHALQPIDVSIKSGDVKRWQWLEPVAKKDAKGKTMITPGVLKVEFHQPVQGKLQGLRVRSLAALPDAKEWVSPDLRVRGAMTRGESLQLQFHPDLPVSKWDAGTFQTQQISADADGRQTLQLADTAANAASSRRPVVVLEPAMAEVHTRENYLWQISPRGATLHADIRYQPARGKLFELTVKLPRPFLNYPIETLELLPEERLGSWHLQGDKLIVELKQPLTPMKSVVVKIRFRNTLPANAVGPRTLAYPDIEPMDATRREGSVAVRVDADLQAQLLNSSLPASMLAPSKADPAPSFQFAFRDQRFTASVRVTPLPMRVRMRGKHIVRLAETQATLTSRWEVEPIAGEVDYLDFHCPPEFPPTWKLHADESGLKVHHWERLHALEALPALLSFGAPSGLHALTSQSAVPKGVRWRFHLAEPLRTKASFTIEAKLPAGMTEDAWRRFASQMPSAQPWERFSGALAADLAPKAAPSKIWPIFLLMPWQSTGADQEIIIESAREPIEKYVAQGYEPVTGAALIAPAPLQTLTLRASGHGDAARVLLLTTRPEKRAISLLEFCDNASVTTFVRKDGRTDHRVRFRLWHGRERTCTLGIPSNLQLVAASVNDHWLDHVDVQNGAHEQRLTLPVDQNAESVRYEIILRGQSEGAFLPGLRSVEMPALDWPIAPLRVKTQICLAADLAPLDHERLASIGAPERFAAPATTWHWLRSLWKTGQSWLPFGSEVTPSLEKMTHQRQAVLGAAGQFRPKSDKPLKLGDALEAFVLHSLKDHCPLVIDQTAFRTRGLHAETVLPTPTHTGRPFWESFGLVYLPCSRAALLTTPERIREFGLDGPADVDALEPALREAILHGEDASASFAVVLNWLKNAEAEPSPSSHVKRYVVAEYEGDFQTMSQWRIGEDAPGGIQLLIFDRVLARLVGWTLAAVLALALLFLHRARSALASFRLNLILVLFSVLCAIWAPANAREFLLWPSIGVELGWTLWSWVRLLGQRHVQTAGNATTVSKKLASAVGAAAIAAFVSYGLAAQPALPRVYSVLLVNEAKPTALLTPELIAKLDELTKPSVAVEHGPVLLRAKYEGTVQDNLARFDAVYDLRSTKDLDTLLLPLAGVQLHDQTLLDGTLVYPTAHKNAYAISIRGKGAHQLRLSFTVRVTASNDHLDLRFTAPKLAQNDVALRWEKPVQAVHCLYCWGEEQRTVNAGAAVSQWTGRLGYENIVHLRWTGAALKPGANSIEVKEAHFWDLRPASLSLVSSLHYAIGKSSLGQLNVALADGLHVRAVEVHALTMPALSTPISIKKWHVTGKGTQRRLVVEFVQPISGNLVLNMEIMPQSIAVRRQMSLPLPAPMQGKSISGLLGYRLDATEVRTTVQNLAVQGMNAADFEQAWKKLPLRSPAPMLTRAYNFQRKAQQAGLELVIQPAVRHAEFDLRWKVDWHHADLLGKVTFTSPLEDLTMLECFIDPAVTLADVRGAEVQRWSLSDGNLQVWLRSSTKRATLELVGWRTLPYKPGPGKRAFPLPIVHPLHVQSFVGSVVLEPAPGLEIDADHLRRLHASAEGKLHYQIDELPYQGSFSLYAGTGTAFAQAVTRIEQADQSVRYTHGLRIATERGKLPAFTIRVKNWSGEPLTLEGAGAAIQRLNSKKPELAWSIKFPSGSPQEVALTLRGRRPMAGAAPFTLPTLELTKIPIRSSYVLWKDVEAAHADTGGKLLSQPALKEEIALLQTSVDLRDLTGWNFARAPRSLRVTLPKTTPHARARVLSALQSIRPDGAGAWTYAIDGWLHTGEPTELRLRLPAKVEQLGAWLDQEMIPLRNPTENEYLLPLPASASPRFMQLRWRYAATAERASAPLSLDLAAETDVRLIWIPPGQVAAAEQAPAVPTLLVHLLADAETHARITGVLASEPIKAAERPSKFIQVHQQQFFVCVRQAEYTIQSMANHVRDFDPAPWQKRLEALKTNNQLLAKERLFEPQRSRAEKAKPITWAMTPFREPREDGIPWKLTPNQDALVLQSAQMENETERRSRTEWLLLVAVFVLVLSFFRHAISLFGALAPEAMLALILVVAWHYGIGLLGVLLVAGMLLIRIYRIRKAWQRRAIATDPVPSTKNTQQSSPR